MTVSSENVIRYEHADLVYIYIRLEVKLQSGPVGKGQHQLTVQIHHPCCLDPVIDDFRVRVREIRDLLPGKPLHVDNKDPSIHIQQLKIK